MKRPARETPPRQGVVLPESDEVHRQLAGLAEDMRSTPFKGNRLTLRLRNFRTDATGYLASLGGPLPFMVRLRTIEQLTAAHLARLEVRYRELSALEPVERDAAWTKEVELLRFDEVNELIDRHNRWYPMEARLPMDPARRDYALVNGRDYRLQPLDHEWVLKRFPPFAPH